jgi:phosphatidylglycerol:prolipoprotein diacylglycerol transferase
MLALAFTVGLWMTVQLAKEDGLPPGKVYDVGLALIPSALLGAQLMTLLDAGAAPWPGSGGYLGGFLMAVAVSAILMRLWRLPWRKSADAFAPSLAAGYGITRLGCFLAGCCWGKPTGSWIGVRFTDRAHVLTGVPIKVSLVPTQLIEAGVSLLIFAALLWLRKRRAFHGQVILAYVLCYSVARFIVEWWRGDPRGSVLGLSTAQFLSAILFPSALMFYVRLRISWRSATAVASLLAGTAQAATVTRNCEYPVSDVRTAFFSVPVTVTVLSPALSVTASANPQTINTDTRSQLSAVVTGGAAPYSYSWRPATGLSAINIANPTAGPQVNTTYTVTVTDALGATASSPVSVRTNMRAVSTANPFTIAVGGSSQLTAFGAPPVQLPVEPCRELVRGQYLQPGRHGAIGFGRDLRSL